MKEFVEVEMKSIYVIITNTQNMANLLSNACESVSQLLSGCVAITQQDIVACRCGRRSNATRWRHDSIEDDGVTFECDKVVTTTSISVNGHTCQKQNKQARNLQNQKTTPKFKEYVAQENETHLWLHRHQALHPQCHNQYLHGQKVFLSSTSTRDASVHEFYI